MTELPTITASRLIRVLQRDGFFIHHSSGSHRVMKHPGRPALRVVVPYHAGDIKRGTLRSILRQANLTVDELIALL
ncbi:MAG: type II toxin-antitoxin system HicA family toxin [Acetobacteraceae bacterium]|jgi:predicted RNA binding protein YcfA (HicA-like mRNA interferase family)